MTDYAVHVSDCGEWVLDSVFDDPEFAIFEAHGLNDKGDYENVRVVELTPGPNGDQTLETIFVASEPSDYSKEIVRRLGEIRDKPHRLPPGVEWRDPDATIG